MKNTNRLIALALGTIVIAQCFCGCKGKKKQQGQTETDSVSQADTSSAKAPVKLKNHMTTKEYDSVTEGALTVLDEPWNDHNGTSGILSEYQDGVYFEICEKEDMLRNIEENPEAYQAWTEEELEDYKTNFVPYINGFVVDGRHYGTMISFPPEDGDWFGWYSVLEEGTLTTKEIVDLQDLKDKLPMLLEDYSKDDYQYCYFGAHLDQELWEKDILRIFQAKKDKTYKELPFGISEQIIDEHYQNLMNPQGDLSWELDKEKIEKIKDQVTEYTFYDEELDRKFVVHVALPKGLAEDAKRTSGEEKEEDGGSAFPALVLTDAVWRFNDISKLLKEMEEGRAKPQILISIGQDYKICNSDNTERSALFCEGKDKFLDFITDNLMPYLGEKYSIDYENSTLFGHSLGGVFVHYALCNSDQYENQPFGCYIIGSPAFWSPYSRKMSDYSEQANDYGYLDRNDTITKHVFITAGSDEDEDYAEYFEDGDSTTESIAHLAERINSKCDPSSPMAKDKLYKSHHYQYIPDMLIEYADEGY